MLNLSIKSKLTKAAKRFKLYHHLLPQQFPKNYSNSINSEPIITTWANLISDISTSGTISDKSLTKASQLFHSNNCNPNPYTLVHLIRACTNTYLFSHTQQLHTHVLKSGFHRNVFVSTSLINFYIKFELLQDAHHLFDEIPQPSVVSWNSLISGYVRSGQFRKALGLFVLLERSNLYADSYSFTSALSACGHLGLVQVGRLLHSKVVKCGVEGSVYVSNCLIDMYGKCGCVHEAMWVFRRMVDKDVISWNSVVAANARNGELERAFVILNRMPCPDTITYNELIDGIARFGRIEDAFDLLSNMPCPNSSSWNSILTGCANRGRGGEGFVFFRKMHVNGVEMNEFTFSSVLSGIASLSVITWGSLVHCCVLKNGFDGHVVVGSALIDMYFKCGEIEKGEILFQSLPGKNVVTWNAVISGYAHNGNSEKVIDLFEKMKDLSQPDEITFLNVLSACWHNRVPLSVAFNYFNMMIRDYFIDPTPEHCCIMVRVMGQEGDLSGAEKMIGELGYECCGMVWKTLLGACVQCGNVEVAEVAANKIIDLEGGDSEFVYVMMSNIYAFHGKWGDVDGMRKMMKARNVRKEAGCSWIHVK